MAEPDSDFLDRGQKNEFSKTKHKKQPSFPLRFYPGRTDRGAGILAILAAFTIPAMLGFVEDAKGKAVIAEAREGYVAAQAAATEIYSDNKEINQNDIREKIANLLVGDIDIDLDNDLWTISISMDGNDIKDVTKDSFYSISIKYGKRDDAGNVLEPASVQELQYRDKTGNYKVTITPGGAAEVTKIEKD